jgi:restriction system protein
MLGASKESIMAPIIGIGIGVGFIPGSGAPRKNTDGNDVLFEDPQNLLLQRSSIWIPEFEAELYSYIRKDPSILYKLPPRKFEELVASIFRNQNYSVELTPESRDGGYDVLAVQKDSITGDKRYIVECKRYSAENKVGVGIVRSLLGVVVDKRATMGILATTSFFTSGATEIEERNQSMISLGNYNNLLKWLDFQSILNKGV